MDKTIERFGRLDILVNNAGGGGELLPCVDMSDESWNEVINWNLNSTFWATRRTLKTMIPQQWGRIINISSVEGKQGKPVLSSYCAASTAINGFAKAITQEVGTLGITVNSLCPGLVLTDIVLENGPSTAEAMGITFEEMVSLYTQESAIKRTVTVEEVAAMAVLLASEPARASPAPSCRSTAARPATEGANPHDAVRQGGSLRRGSAGARAPGTPRPA